MSTIKSLIGICALAIEAKDMEMRRIEANITQRDRHWEELDAEVTRLGNLNAALEAKLETFEAEVARLTDLKLEHQAEITSLRDTATNLAADVEVLTRNKDDYWKGFTEQLTKAQDLTEEVDKSHRTIASQAEQIDKLFAKNQWLEQQRDNLLRQHAMVCGQRDDEISKTQKLLRMMKDHIDTAMNYDKAMWESTPDVPTFHDLRAQYHRHDGALTNVLELITNNLDKE